MRPLVFFVLFLSVLAPGFSQTAVGSDARLPNDPRAILSAALPFYDFSSPELKSWHLKATYQFYNLKGKPTEQGTWEYWWASPKVHRSSWTRAGAEYTTWSTGEGAVYRKGTEGHLRYFETTIDNTLLSPLPGRVLLESAKMKLDLKMLPPDKPALACVIASPGRLGDRKLEAAIPDMARDYCFDPQTMALRIVYSDPLTTRYGQLVKIEGRYLARQVVVQYGNQTLFSVSVDTIEGFNPTDPAFSPPADAVLEKAAPQGNVQGGVMVGSLVKKTIPDYPLMSKMNHEQGLVVLAAVIGTDGRVHYLEVLASPSPLLADSAVDAVKKWEYKPYLLNGQPVEVETMVKVYFNLGR